MFEGKTAPAFDEIRARSSHPLMDHASVMSQDSEARRWLDLEAKDFAGKGSFGATEGAEVSGNVRVVDA